MVMPPSSRQVLVWSLPTVAFVLSILWYRRRHQGSKQQTDPGGTLDTTISVGTEPTLLDLQSSGPEQSIVSEEICVSKEVDCILLSSPPLAETSPNLCEVIATQKEILSLQTEVAAADKSISVEDIVEISSPKQQQRVVKCDSSVEVQQIEPAVCEAATTSLINIAHKEELKSSPALIVQEDIIIESPVKVEQLQASQVKDLEEQEQQTNSAVKQAEVFKSNQVKSSKSKKEKINKTSVGTNCQGKEVSQSGDFKTITSKMTEVEEPTQVSSSVTETGEVAPTSSALTKITVDVTSLPAATKSSTPNVAETKREGSSQQPRDSANHSPAEAMLASPSISNDSDTHSVGSSDSGKGGSDVTTPVLEEDGLSAGLGSGHVVVVQSPSSRRASTSSASSSQLATTASTELPPPLQPSVFEFVIPQHLVGRLIGKHGCFVQQIHSITNTSIFVKRHPESAKMKVCAIEGAQADIDKALDLIRKKFPSKKYPSVTLERVSFVLPTSNYPLIPESLQMYLVEGVNNDVILSSLVTGGHMFLQQPTHPTFPVLSRLIMNMTRCYAEEESPTLPNPASGIVCAAPSMGGWYRAEVMDVRADEPAEGEDDEVDRMVCDVKFVDYGGFMTIPASELRQIRTDFMMLPFQATECFLADVTWLDDEETWSEEATQCMEELTRGQMLQAQVVGYAENGTPLVRLFSSMNSSIAVMVNEILVARGLAKYIEPLAI